MLSLRVRAYEVAGKIYYGCSFPLVVVMKISTLPFPFAKAMDVTNQVLFLIILASLTNGKLEKAVLQKIAPQLKVTHYDCGRMTYVLNQVSKCNIAPENLDVSGTVPTRNQCNRLQSQISEWTMALWLWRRLMYGRHRPQYSL